MEIMNKRKKLGEILIENEIVSEVSRPSVHIRRLNHKIDISERSNRHRHAVDRSRQIKHNNLSDPIRRNSY